uniref:Chalcone-flavanone isomerase family protein n=1 Tax=Zea mays TaxID=4577 RepID=A0A804PC26_MAIZE
METPLSSRRITRSLAAASAQKSAAAGPDSAALFSRAKNAAAGETQPRAALHDITNDSPIVGLAAGALHATDTTPASTAAKTRRRAPRRTPGSGEALLRGQVKALLHKVEEEQGCAAAAIVRPARIQALLGVSRSPAQLLAPTPANTPQIEPVPTPREGLLLLDGATVVPCVLDEEELLIPKLQAEEKLGDCQLNRALVFDDSPEKCEESSGSAVSSTFSLQESSTGSYVDKSSSPEDDSSSAWSIQVHASSEKGDEEELGVEELAAEYTDEEEEEEEEDWDEDSDDDCYDDLCEEMSRMTVLEEEEKKKTVLPQFEGKHTRFIYNSDDEIERVEEADAAEATAELRALMLRGLLVPEGRHLRFHDEDADE